MWGGRENLGRFDVCALLHGSRVMAGCGGMMIDLMEWGPLRAGMGSWRELNC